MASLSRNRSISSSANWENVFPRSFISMRTLSTALATDVNSPATNSNGIDISGIASNSNVVFGLQVEASSGGGTYGDFNFGSPSFSISSSNTDGNGYGNFEYAVPSGYYSLNTKNLAEYG